MEFHPEAKPSGICNLSSTIDDAVAESKSNRFKVSENSIMSDYWLSKCFKQRR
jgi:hypothetical protein